MTDLERWYRFAMFAYPNRYRRDREDDLIAALIDAAGQRSRPSMRSLVAIVVNGVLCRCDQSPDVISGRCIGHRVALAMAVIVTTCTVAMSAGFGHGHFAGSASGTTLWIALIAVLVVGGVGTTHVRVLGRVMLDVRVVGRVVLVGWAMVALAGGAALMGAYRPFIAAIIILAVVALCDRGRDRRTIWIAAAAATFGSVAGLILMARSMAGGQRRYPDVDFDTFWNGNPWLFVQLDRSTPLIGAIALVVVLGCAGLHWPKLALTGAVLALPSFVAARLLTQSVALGVGDRASIGAIAAAGAVGVAATLGLLVIALRTPRSQRDASASAAL